VRIESEAVRGMDAAIRRRCAETNESPSSLPTPQSMSVLYLTIFVSTALALFFVGAFLYHHDFSGGDSMRDSLLPFEKEKRDKNGKDGE